jgi:acetamidase/formamidase
MATALQEKDRRIKNLNARFDTVHFGFYDAGLPPVMEVESGEAVFITTLSADPAHDVPAQWLPPEIHDIFTRAQRGPGPHILTGPILIRGARAGDVLQIDILDIRLTQRYGYNNVSPLKGMFGTRAPIKKTAIIPIDIDGGRAEVVPGLWVSTRPFFGQMAVAPPPEWGRLDSRPPNKFGGNLDNKELCRGARLWLPIWAEGALFSVGDGHAAQGDGEVNQTAIETSLEGYFRLTLRTDFALELPLAATPDHLITMGFHENLDEAARIAMHSMIDLLEKHCGMKFHDAYRLCSIVADMRVTQFVNGNRGIHVMFPRMLLRQLPCRIEFFAGMPISMSAADKKVAKSRGS